MRVYKRGPMCWLFSERVTSGSLLTEGSHY